MKVLVTGGAGYIGSTVCSALIDAGHTPIILDCLEAGKIEFTKDRIFYEGDIADEVLLNKIFSEHPDIYCCIHLAAKIIVADSVENPYDYYCNNVIKSVKLFKALDKLGCKRIVFSSSAAVYDQSDDCMVTELSPVKPASPYARTTLMTEMALQDFANAMGFKTIILRYFNAVGADPKMRSGSYEVNPSHILDKLVAVANGKDPIFFIKGVDWPTKDGSGVRDYIHVWDLATAHVCAAERFDNIFDDLGQNHCIINLGTGKGITVKQFVAAFEAVIGRSISKNESYPRPGDVAGAYASYDKAKKLLSWKPRFSIEDCIRDAIKWTEENRKDILGY